MPDNINREYKDRLFAFIFGNPASRCMNTLGSWVKYGKTAEFCRLLRR